MITPKQAIQLFSDCLDNRISEDDGVALLGFLEADPKFTQDVYDNLYIDCLLHQRKEDDFDVEKERCQVSADTRENDLLQWVENLERLAAATAPASPSPVVRKKTQRFPSWLLSGTGFLGRYRRTIVLLGCILFTMFGLYGLYHEMAVFRRPAVIGHLTGFDEVVWDDEETAIHLGDPIRMKKFRLRSGSISLKTLTGAEVVLEGPAELEMSSPTSWNLKRGYLATDIPPQKRKLRLRTPQMTIDVLGTAFWVKADADISEVHLIRGRLNLHGPSISSQLIEAGDAVSMSTAGNSKLFKALDNQFVHTSSLIEKAGENFRRKHEQALNAADADPSLLVFFDFQELGRVVFNRAAHGKALVPSAQVEGCAQMSGAVPGEQAVEFRRKSDRLILDLPRLLKSFTLFARIRVDAEVRHRCALLVSEEARSGSIQWLIAQNGTPVLNISRDKNSVSDNYAAPEIFQGKNLRRWKNIAVVYDTEKKKVDWYLDGGLLDSQPIKSPIDVMLGRAMIGNRGTQTDVLPPGAGFGLSEIRLYERALDENEIIDLSNH